MSFVAKAVKKVFKAVKKVVKKVVKSKWFKIAAVIALTVFTAGVATAGFAAFAGVSSVGSFFSAVGTTMASGWTAIVGGIKAVGAKAASLFGAGGGAGAGTTTAATGALGGTQAAGGAIIGNAAVGAGELASATALGNAAAGGVLSSGAQATFLATEAAGITGSSLLASGSALVPMATSGATQASSGGFLSKLTSSILGNNLKGTMSRGGIMMGINGYLRGKEREAEEYYRHNRTIWGGQAFGGDSGPLNISTFQGRGQQEEPTVAKQQAQAMMQPQEQPDAVGTAAPGLLGGGGPVVQGTPPGQPPVASAPTPSQAGLLAQAVPPTPTPETSQAPPAAPPAQAPVRQRFNPELLGVA